MSNWILQSVYGVVNAVSIARSHLDRPLKDQATKYIQHQFIRTYSRNWNIEDLLKFYLRYILKRML